MKRLLAISLTVILSILCLSACGDEYDFYTIEKGKKNLSIKFDDPKDGYKWVSKIGNLDKLRLVSEKEKGGEYKAKFKTITKSGKGKKSGKGTVAFSYVNEKDPSDVIEGYVLTVSIDAKGKMTMKRVDELKVNSESKVDHDD